MTTPAPCPEIVAKMQAKPSRTMIVLLTLGDTLWDFLDLSGPDVRAAAADIMSATLSEMPPATRQLLIDQPLAFKQILQKVPELGAKMEMSSRLAQMAMDAQSNLLLAELMVYFSSIRVAEASSPAPSPSPAPTTAEMPEDSKRRKFLAATRKEIADRLGVPVEDVIILDDTDLG